MAVQLLSCLEVMVMVMVMGSLGITMRSMLMRMMMTVAGVEC